MSAPLPSVSRPRPDYRDLCRVVDEVFRLLREATPPTYDDPLREDILTAWREASGRWDTAIGDADGGLVKGVDTTVRAVAVARAMGIVTSCAHAASPWPAARTVFLDRSVELCDPCVAAAPDSIVMDPAPFCAYCHRPVEADAALYTARVAATTVIGTVCAACRRELAE